MTKRLENNVKEMGEDEHEKKLEQENGERICKWVISKPDSLGVDLIGCAMTYERLSKRIGCNTYGTANEVFLTYLHGWSFKKMSCKNPFGR